MKRSRKSPSPRSMNWRDHIPKSYPAARAAGAREMWSCPACREDKRRASCALCQGSGTFDPAVLLKLRMIRREEGMTLEDVAGELGCSRQAIFKLEMGQSLAPRPRQRYRREPADLLLRYLTLCRRTGGEMWWPMEA